MPTPLKFIYLVVLSLVCSAASAAVAHVLAKPARLGLCAACHGESGVAQVAGAPNLAGQRLDYLRAALAQYRDGRRDVPLMRAAVGPVSTAELDALARWYSAQLPAASAAATKGAP